MRFFIWLYHLNFILKFVTAYLCNAKSQKFQNQVDFDLNLPIFFFISRTNALLSWQSHYFKLAKLQPITYVSEITFSVKSGIHASIAFSSGSDRKTAEIVLRIQNERSNSGYSATFIREIGSAYRESKPIVKGSTIVSLLKN